MALSVVNNLSSLTAQLALSNTTTALNSSIEKLSTGLRINTGADDPSGLVVSNEQKAQIAGLNQAITNTSNAVNLVQTGEGALSEISTLLDQARSLALDSANTGVTDSTAAAANQAQFSNILSTIDNIANTTQFGNTKLLNGSAGVTSNYVTTGNVTTGGSAYTVSGSPSDLPSLTYTVGNFQAATATQIENTTTYTAPATAGTVTINGVAVNLTAAETETSVISAINAVTGQTGVTAAVGQGGGVALYSNTFGTNGSVNVQVSADTAAHATALATAVFGTAGTQVGSTAAYQLTATTGVNATISLTGTSSTGATYSSGTITGSGDVLTFNTAAGLQSTNNGSAFSGLVITLGTSGSTDTSATQNQYTSAGHSGDTLTINNGSLQFQTGANAGNTASVSFGSVLTSALGAGASGVVNTNFTSLANVTLDTGASDATDAVRVIDQAIQQVSTEAGNLGAFQDYNLQANATNLQAALTNTTAAESTVTDTNFASEIANFSQLQVQQEAGASVLGIANQLPSTIADLLSKLS